MLRGRRFSTMNLPTLALQTHGPGCDRNMADLASICDASISDYGVFTHVGFGSPFFAGEVTASGPFSSQVDGVCAF